MKTSFDPARLDVAQFSRQAGELRGEWRLTRLKRLAEAAVDPESAPPVRWFARGESLRRPGHFDEVWLALRAEAEVGLACQRCLQTMAQRLMLDTRIRFVYGEDAAARLDEEIESDVLALTRSLDLGELIEDELLLALPIVPRHEACPDGRQAGTRSAGHPAVPQDAEVNPFAMLRQLLPGQGRE
jgi:uncharacterized protein